MLKNTTSTCRLPRILQTIAVSGLLLTLAGASGAAQLPRLSQLMRQKLAHSQGLLEALVLGDYATMEELADELIRVSELSDWSSSQDPEYLHYARSFRETAEVLLEDARAADLDGAALSYMEMTLTCVRCHRYLSETRQAATP